MVEREMEREHSSDTALYRFVPPKKIALGIVLLTQKEGLGF